jgi:hypothetical protein
VDGVWKKDDELRCEPPRPVPELEAANRSP